MNNQMEMDQRSPACRFAPAWQYRDRNLPAGAKRQAATGLSGIWPFAILLLLAGFLLFAHGCHGDEDTELLTQFVVNSEW
jgi:hypothetical protein